MKKPGKFIWTPVLTAALLGLSATSAFAGGPGCKLNNAQPRAQGMGCDYRQDQGEIARGSGCAHKHDRHKGMQRPAMKPTGKGRGMDPAMKVKRMAQHLNLNADQQTRLKDIMESSNKLRDALHTRVQENRTALKEAMASGDMDQIRSLAEQKGDLIAARIVMKAEQRENIRAMLTPEQQERFDRMKERRMHRH